VTAPDQQVRELHMAMERGEDILIVHYGCENLYDAKDHPAAVACIGVVDIRDDTSYSFSVADAPPSVEGEAREVDMLDRFYRYLQEHSDAHLIHWNMNSSTYGFAALSLRYRYLTGKRPAYEPPVSRLKDLDYLISQQFGDEYAKHPKLSQMAALNRCNMRFFLAGAEEASRFANGDIGAVKNSITTKTRVISALLNRFVEGTLQTQTSVGMVTFAHQRLDAVSTVLELGTRIVYVRRELARRRTGRPVFEFKDEYDAQDLVRALLRVFFEDVRAESITPQYAGGSSRIDFVIPEYRLAIELKHSRKSMSDRDLADELIIDRDRYQADSRVNHLICLVFDYEGYLTNPRGLETDLERESSAEGLAVTVRIYDR
jgi:REase_DpnII-MboI